MERELIAGIIGGMGPEATVDLMRHIIRLTPAAEDNDHIRCVVDNNAKIPSRVKALYENSGISPAPALCDSARRLEAYGVDFLIIPCNTAHYYYEDVRDVVSIPVLNILDIAVDASKARLPQLGRIGLLATTATVKTGLYKERFTRAGVELITPDDERQAETLALINAIKAGHTGPEQRGELARLASWLGEHGAEAVVLGCTELGLVSDGVTDQTGIPLIDTVIELARATVTRVKGRTTEGADS